MPIHLMSITYFYLFWTIVCLIPVCKQTSLSDLYTLALNSEKVWRFTVKNRNYTELLHLKSESTSFLTVV